MVLAIVDGVPAWRVHVAWSDEQAAAWWGEFDAEKIPESDGGQAISEEGFEALVGTGRPGRAGELEPVFPEKPDFPGSEGNPKPSAHPDADDQRYHSGSEEAPVGFRLGPKGLRFIACMHPQTGFRAFLGVWDFLDKDSGVHRTLGEALWPGQELVVEHVQEHARVYQLKARQLGETTLAVAYDGYVMRFRGHGNTRVHLVSRTEELAKTSLLKPMKDGLRTLPPEMRLPEKTDTTTVFEYNGGEGDRRIAVAYSAKEPGRGETCSHLHLDEWAAMMETSPELPKEVWAAAEPSISKDGGTAHILTTGVGPVGYYADVWKQCVGGDGPMYPCFIKASGSRPDYTPEFLARKKRDMADDAKFAHEYPDTWEDALAGAGEAYFPSALINEALIDARGFSPAGVYTHKRTGRTKKRKYVKAWDLAGPSDRADYVVCVVLDVTEPIWDVVHFERHKGEDYPVTARRIEHVHRLYPGITYVEDNEAGKAVRAFVNLTEDECKGHVTTRSSKPQCLAETKYALQDQALKWRDDECPALSAEMRVYKTEDAALVQDSVMALSIAVHYGPEASADTGGKILPFGSYGI